MVRMEQSKFHFFFFYQDLGWLQLQWKDPRWIRQSRTALLLVWPPLSLSTSVYPNASCHKEYYLNFPSNIELNFFYLICFTQGIEFKQIHWRNSSFLGKAFQPLLVGPSRQSADWITPSINRYNSWHGPASECKAFVSILYLIPRGHEKLHLNLIIQIF